MKHRVLWKLSVCTPGREEELAEWLTVRFGQTAVSYSDLETGKTTVSVYLESKPDWSEPAQGDLRRALRRMAGSSNGQFDCCLTRLRNQDWAEAWKRHFKPLNIGSRLLIKPTWSRIRAQPGQVVVELDPGMSFGTGHHPTTAFCLSELVRLRAPGTAQSFLDLGAGSGILSIAAAKLGYGPIEGVEVDRASLKVARANARLNHVEERLRFRCRDVAGLPMRPSRQYDVVCANLTADLLVGQKERLRASVKPSGHLVLAGILSREFGMIRAAYQSAGMRSTRNRQAGEWRSGSFSRSVTKM